MRHTQRKREWSEIEERKVETEGESTERGKGQRERDSGSRGDGELTRVCWS